MSNGTLLYSPLNDVCRCLYVSFDLKWKLTVSFISPQSLESTRRMLQLVEEVRKTHETFDLFIKSETNYDPARIGNECGDTGCISCVRLGKVLVYAG